jgi:hypothetical protein
VLAEMLEQRLCLALFTVANTNDAGPGSLRQAIIDANAVASADEIVFATAAFATSKTISLLTALPQVSLASGPLTITGTGAEKLTIRRDPAAATNFRILNSATPTLNLRGFTISGGNPAGDGGGILIANVNNVTLDGMVLTGNSGDEGGAIYLSFGSFLTVRNSTIRGNSATTDAPGIYFINGGGLLVEGSTLSDNTAPTGSGGAIYFYGAASTAPPPGYTPGAIVVRNSNLSGNTVGASGGAILLGLNFTGTLQLQNSTISGNQAGAGGGILQSGGNGSIQIQNSTIVGNSTDSPFYGGGGIARIYTSGPGSITVSNSIISGNTATTDGPDLLANSVTTTNINFSAIGNSSGFTMSASSGNNLPFSANLQLGSLSSNGGPTLTMLPASASPLINAGSNALVPSGLVNDQRGTGFARIRGPAVDIGAVEVQPPGPPVALATASDVGAPGGTTYSFTVRYSDPLGTNNAIDVSTIGNGDIRVTGPDGFDLNASFVNVDINTSGTPRTATYAITPPGGSWDVPDMGTYSINMRSIEVADIDGNFVPAGAIGSFVVDLPQTFLVSNTNNSGPGSLRQALINANATNSSDTIVFDTAGVFATPQTISLITPLPQIAASGGALTINGTGASNLTIRKGSPTLYDFGIFNSMSPSLTLTSMTITGGYAVGDGIRGGGALLIDRNESTAILDGVVMTANGSGYAGGAIYVSPLSTLIIRNSTISGNSAPAGGGIYFYATGTLYVDNSTLSGNSATSPSEDGGAIHFFGGSRARPGISIRNSTINNNTAAGRGGGIYLDNFREGLVIQNSTIAGNSATAGGAIMSRFGGGSVDIQNTTITGNTATGISATEGGGGIAFRPGSFPETINITNSIISGNSNPKAPDIFAPEVSYTTLNVNFSAIGSSAGFTMSSTSGNNVPFGSNLRLGPLANNGGATQTMLPHPTSPLINAGSNAHIPAGLTADQRGPGYDRVRGSIVDVGAVENEPQPSASADAASITTPGATSLTFTASYSATGAIDTATVVGNHNALRVTGPSGFSVSATFLSIDNPADGTPRTATYSFTPPGGSWDWLDNGTYTIALQSNQVGDVDGNFLPAATLGSFAVAIPQTFLVTNTSDNGEGSLRQAVINANSAAGLNFITFQPGLTGTITLTSGSITIADPLTIIGPGAGTLTVRRSSTAAAFRIFDSTASALGISGLTISGGNAQGSAAAGSGGALRAMGTSPQITLEHLVVSANAASQEGGAIYLGAGAFLTLRNSTISGNSAGTSGAAIRLLGGGSFNIDSTTISHNTASAGGFGDAGGILFSGAVSASPPPGFLPSTLLIRNSTINNNSSLDGAGGIVLLNSAGNLTVINTTIAANTAGFGGGGISLSGDTGVLTIQNSTISGNGSNGPFGGGAGGISRISGSQGTINITNSIVSGNSHRNTPDILASPATTTNVNYSAIGSSAGFTMSPSSGNNLPLGANLMLGSLQNNGGPTRTMAPQPLSPLINAGSNALVPSGLTTDQRAFPRIVGARTDIGAVEYVINGDLNFDGSVSIADFLTVSSNFNKTEVTWTDGDLNGDGAVTISDFLALAANFGQSLPEPPAPAAALSATLSSSQDSAAHRQQRNSTPHRPRLKLHHPRPLLSRFHLL